MEVAPTTAMAPKNLVVDRSRRAIVVPARTIFSRSDRSRSLNRLAQAKRSRFGG